MEIIAAVIVLLKLALCNIEKPISPRVSIEPSTSQTLVDDVTPE